ncbi:MAG: hypothetical protein HY422_01205 [Candidatus Komeilibacteria bacterium]|nr:hypothetical protein [Candidatus Komeilibacteria bacterium]
MAEKIVGLKALREHTDTYIAQVQKGATFLVMRKSKPVFRLIPVDGDVWETVVDFSSINPQGVPLDIVKKAITGLLTKERHG